MKSRKRRAKKRLKVLLFMAGLMALLLMLLFAPFFNIRAIEVSGSTRYTPDKIKEASGIIPGENGFRKLKATPKSILELRLLDSEDRVRQLPYIKDCTVRLVFPDRIHISVTERETAAYIRYLDHYLVVDEEGYVLEALNQPPDGNLKEIKGIEFSKYTIGEQLEASDMVLIRAGVEVIKAVIESDKNSEFKLHDVLDYVDLVDKNTVLLSLDNRIVVRFDPQDKLQYTIDFTKEIFFKKINTKETGRIEFSGNQNPSFIPE